MADRERGIKYKSEKRFAFEIVPSHMIQRDLWQKYDRASIFPNQSISFKIETSRLCTSPDQTLICERCPLFCAKYGSWNSYEVVLAVLFFGRKKSRSQKSRFLFFFYPLISHFYTDFSRHVLRAFLRLMCHWYIYTHMWIWCVCVLFMWPQDWPCPYVRYFWMSKKCEKYLTLIPKLKSFFVEH